MSSFLQGKDVHGWINTNGFSEDPRLAGESSADYPRPRDPRSWILRLERPEYVQILEWKNRHVQKPAARDLDGTAPFGTPRAPLGSTENSVDEFPPFA